MEGFYSVFDGLPQLVRADAPPTAEARAVVEVATSVIMMFSGLTGSTLAGDLRDIIIAKAKLSNQITEDLVRRYHTSFTSLYEYSKKVISKLNTEIMYLRNPARNAVSIIEFKPRDIVVDADMTMYIIQAMAEGKELKDVLPSHLLTQ
jgi:hypothetical protein